MVRSKNPSSMNVDWLSSLPDSILHHILSFLPTYFAVQTSVLARRWRFLWTDVPTINLYFHPYGKWSKEGPQNSDIINRVLLGHNLKDLNTFKLVHTVSNEKDYLTRYQLETWIAAVIAYGKVRKIRIGFNYPIKLPDCLFTYKSLVKLRLNNCEIRISFPASICFPSLKKLHLCFVKYNNDETFQHLISGCSILEELEIAQFWSGDLVCCRISSPTLKWLTIDFGFLQYKDHMMELMTPALRYLHVQDCLSKCKISSLALSSLTEADINIAMYEDDVVYPHSMFELLDRISNVKCLNFDTNCKLLHSTFFILPPRFDNLTKLELVTDWRLMLGFLEIADNLQVLVINRVVQNRESCEVPQQVFTCLLSHLRSIVINSFRPDKYDYTMVRYLLKNAKVLTSMKIRSLFRDYKENFDALQRISLFERGSEACKLDFK